MRSIEDVSTELTIQDVEVNYEFVDVSIVRISGENKFIFVV